LHGNWAAGAIPNRLLAADFKRLTRTEIRTSSLIANSILQSPDSGRHSDPIKQLASRSQIATPGGQRRRHIGLTHQVWMLEQRADGRRSTNCLACHDLVIDLGRAVADEGIGEHGRDNCQS
jgi:hypothetical protein